MGYIWGSMFFPEQGGRGVRRILSLICVAAVVFGLAQAAYAGLGDPLGQRSPDDDAKALKSTEGCKRALEALAAKGYSKEQAEAALEKMPAQQLELLGSLSSQEKAGGDILGFLLFVLFVGLIIYLILVLIEAADRRYYY
jgi:hypothetical protein